MRYLINIFFSIALGLVLLDNITKLFAGRHFDESALYTIVYGFEGVNYSGFYKEIAIITVCIALLLTTLFFLHTIPFVGRILIKFKYLSIAICAAVIMTSNPFKTIAQAYFGISGNLLTANHVKNKFYQENEFSNNYTKNLVFIYLESFERSYLDENAYPNLAPNLARLAQEADQYTNIYALVSAAWTMGGKVASQCGIPLITPLGSANNLSKIDTFLPDAVCIGDILRKANYNLEYIGGAKKEFAGKDKFYTVHGFNSVKGLDELIRSEENSWSWGRSDEKTLLDVLERYQFLQQFSAPFGLFALTLDTHGPDGNVPEICGALKYGDGSNRMLNAVHCNDKIVADFIHKIRSHPKFENTILVLASDHPLGGNLYEDHKRNLFLVFDASREPQEYAKKGTPFDIGATTLGYMSTRTDHKLGLGRNLRDESENTLAESVGGPEDVDNYIAANRSVFAAHWGLPTKIDDGIKLADSKTVIIANQKFTLPTVIQLKGTEISKIVLEELGALTDTFDQFAKATINGDEAILIAKCDALANYIASPTAYNGICSLASNGLGEQFLLQLNSKLTYSKFDFFPSDTKPDSHVKLKDLNLISKYKSIPEFVIYDDDFDSIDLEIISVGLNAGAKSKLKIGDITLDSKLRRGLNIIQYSNTSDATLLDTLDTCLPKLRDDNKLIKEYLSERSSNEKIVIIAHDSAFCPEGKRLSDVFAGSSLTEGAKLRLREPYIALVSNNTISEYKGSAAFPLIVTNNKDLKHHLISGLD